MAKKTYKAGETVPATGHYGECFKSGIETGGEWFFVKNRKFPPVQDSKYRYILTHPYSPADEKRHLESPRTL